MWANRKEDYGEHLAPKISRDQKKEAGPARRVRMASEI